MDRIRHSSSSNIEGPSSFADWSEPVAKSSKLLFTVTFLRRLPPLPAVVLSERGGAGFLVSCYSDCYQIEAVERP
ncbi:hypothetical protein F511_08064 [Dorcoceras hygrometricum]|uniref:Uncharacterized protein n=1 Tax=Dorcoceras hygrometricum TaxID=472368 RepID=A0A2Z7CUE0_9LAMI|nr:hypothetical protein F511_08064 [Dorcoceras hygrometricum]